MYIVILLLVIAALEQPVDAYLDPGTGSMVLQAVLGGLAAGAIIVRAYWLRLKARLTGSRSELPPGSRA